MKATILDINNQLNRICSIVENMLALSGMMRGSFGAIYQRCGKSTCWCAKTKGKGHLCMRLMWTDEHGVKTRSVRQEDIQTVKEAIEQYHEFKDIRRKLRIEEKKLEKLLGEFERKTTLNSKSKMGYL
jgi:hypothetical protein